MYPWLDDAVAKDGVVVTASRRLARELRASFNQQQIESGLEAWHTPRIHFWNDWLVNLLETASPTAEVPLRIDQHSATVLWERCLKEHSQQPVINFAGLVRLAMQSWQRVFDWQVPVRELARAAQNQDQELFAAAAWSYQKILHKNDWTDAAGVSALVSNLLSSKSLTVPTRITVAGFDRQTSAIEAVIAQLRENGCELAVAPAPAAAANIQLGSYVDSAAQLRAAGKWARDALQETPDARLAVVCPNLDTDAASIVRLIREGLVPGWQCGGPDYKTAANVSYGRQLAAYPLITVALYILRWVTDGLRSRDLSVLLRSDFFAGISGGGRARLELELRRLPDRTWSPGDAWNALQHLAQDSDASRWLECTQLLVRMQGIAAQQRSPSEWTSRIDILMDELGWPGLEGPDSKEFQLINRWRELLNELARTEAVQSRITLDAAVRRLASIASETIYQPEIAPGVLQVVGTLEAAGMEFDAVWVTDMDSTQWPAAGHPSSLIAKNLQRRYGLPDSSPEDTLDYSRRVLQRLVTCAPEVIFSWARTEQDSELAVTPLLDDMSLEQAATFVDPGWHALSYVAVDALVADHEDRVPAIAAGERVAGGAYTVQRQLVEPFAAFAAGRLRIADMRRFEAGLSATLRGSLIHSALHALYRDCPSLHDIQAWSDSTRQEQVVAAVNAALAPQWRLADPVLARLLELERVRMQSLLMSFLQAESTREHFDIAAVEAEFAFSRHGVDLQLRLDRLDRLADGSLLIMDYKSGAPRNLLNREGIPADFQLVVYSCAVDKPVGGIALVNVDSRGIDYKAAGGSVQWDRRDAEDWPGRLDEWQGLVDGALQQMASGDVRINLRLSATDGRAFNLLSRLEEQRRAQ